MTGSVVPSAPDGLSRTSSAAGSGVGSSSDRPPRPATIAELAERALNDLWDPARDLKYWLRLAQKHRNEGKDLADHGKYEEAFVLFARSATIVLEKLPTHRDYNTLLTPQQRQNLGLNGQDILDSLSKLKPTLVDLHERWVTEHGGDSTSSSGSAHEFDDFLEPHFAAHDDRYGQGRGQDHQYQRQQSHESFQPPTRPPTRPGTAQDMIIPPGWNVEDDSGVHDLNERMDGLHVTAEDDYNRGRWQHFQDDRERDRDQGHSRSRKDSSVRRRMAEHAGRPRADSASRRMDERRRTEQDGILRRQRESDAAAAHAARSAPVSIPSSVSGSYNPTARTRSPAPGQIPVSIGGGGRSHGHSHRDSYTHPAVEAVREQAHEYRKRQPMSREQTSTWEGMSESYGSSKQGGGGRSMTPSATMPNFDIERRFGWDDPVEPYRRGQTPVRGHTPAREQEYEQHYGNQNANARPLGPAVTMPSSFPHYTPAPGLAILPLENPNTYESDTDKSDGGGAIAIPQPRHHNHTTPARARRPSMPPPMTTTSPAPHAFPIRYPSLMSLHQRTQGYKPSLESMFKPEADDNDTPQGNEPSMLFGTTPQSYGSTQSYRTIGDRVIPSPPEDIRAPGWPGPGPSSYSPQGPMQSYPQGVYPHGQAGPSRIETSARDPVTHHLKTVSLPRECLPRFLSIAAVNTAANRETCGLLLGKDRGTKYAVTTLLVPKQRATSDTCAMEEEELVLQFTEERNLITLGWIHTHPTQSCFMSSLDLHTHAGFQRMLPESFAVVCSPKHEPPFGIFRLTDPPGLDIILDCTAKEAFHPHIAAPIYTDADKGHVIMKEMSLEIVDLR